MINKQASSLVVSLEKASNGRPYIDLSLQTSRVTERLIVLVIQFDQS